MGMSSRAAQFTVLNRTSDVRRGTLRLGDHLIHTPNILITTQRLTVPHLTPDVLRRTLQSSDYAGFLVDVESLLEDGAVLSSTTPVPLATLMGYAEDAKPIIIASKDATYCCPSPATTTLRNGTDHISVLTGNGVASLKIPQFYSTLLPSLKPNVIISPIDHYAAKTARIKRIKRATENTRRYYTALLPLSEGTTCLAPAIHLHSSSAEGETGEGQALVQKEMEQRAALPPSTRQASPLVSLLCGDATPTTILHHLSSISSSSSSAILFRGPLKPSSDLLAILGAGVDLIETSGVTDAATAGIALSLSLQDPSLMTSLDMRDPAHFEDFTPLAPDCGCIACAGPDQTTRAYIHHLVMNAEMLGSIYLSSHNLWQLARLLRQLRERNPPDDKGTAKE